jgi:hypothetical protein
MYWWHHAAQLTRRGAVQRFGFITTNSIRQSFNRRVLEPHLGDKKEPLSLVFAIPDHPWVDSTEGAAVRIAMTVGASGEKGGLLMRSVAESEAEGGERDITLRIDSGALAADLSVGVNVTAAMALRANSGLCWQGCKLVGSHFQIDPELRQQFVAMEPASAARLPRYTSGIDLARSRTLRYVIDTYGLDEAQLRSRYPIAVPAFAHLRLSGTRTE